MDNDDFNQIAGNVSTVIDLLEAKGISWSQYQQDMPYTGYEGYSWVNQDTKANDYVRKHNPAIIYDASKFMLSDFAKTTLIATRHHPGSSFKEQEPHHVL